MRCRVFRIVGHLISVALICTVCIQSGAEEPNESSSSEAERKTEPAMNNQPEKELSSAAQKQLLQIARGAVEAAVRGGKPPSVEIENEELGLLRGVFVTLTSHGKLRGCIGRFEADLPVARIVSEMGVAAATQDYRFLTTPITPEELSDINIEISVLSPLKKIENPLDIVLGRHGICIRRGNRSGTFLPQVATEHSMSKEDFLSMCCSHKAGLSPDAWKDPETDVYIYVAQVFSEESKHE